jgi:hypothetical protein
VSIPTPSTMGARHDPPFFEKACDIAPRGRLRRYLPADQPWRKSIGGDVIRAVFTGSRQPTPWQLEQLEDTHRIAEAIAQQCVEARAEAAKRRGGRRSTPVLYTRSLDGRRWRGRAVPIMAALTVRPEGTA